MYADQRARARRRSGSRLERDEALRAKVLSGLKQGWSPEQVCGRPALECGERGISYEIIYRFIYGQLGPEEGLLVASLLASREVEEGLEGSQGRESRFLHTPPMSLAEGPQSAQDRRTPGHWEADLMLYRTYGQAVLTMHERHSRLAHSSQATGKDLSAHSCGYGKGAGSPAPGVASDRHLR